MNNNAISRVISVIRLESGFILLRINLQRCDVCEYDVNIKHKQRLIDLAHLLGIFNRLFKVNMADKTDDFIANYFAPHEKVQLQPTLPLTLPDPSLIKSASSKQDRSTPSSPSPSTISWTSANSFPPNVNSFVKISSPNDRTTASPSSENGLLMTLIQSSSTNSQRTPANELGGTNANNEELSNNGKFIKSKVTAALNHMKYRKYKHDSPSTKLDLIIQVGQ